MIKPHIVLITGARQVGKSTLCVHLIERLRTAHFQVSGLLSHRTGPHDLEVEGVHNRTRYRLTRPFVPHPGRRLRHFQMDEAAIVRSRRDLETSVPTDVLVVDELGPLEFTHGRGWANAFGILIAGHYECAIVVIRPELLSQAMACFEASCYTVVYVTPKNRDTLEQDVWKFLFDFLRREM